MIEATRNLVMAIDSSYQPESLSSLQTNIEVLANLSEQDPKTMKSHYQQLEQILNGILSNNMRIQALELLRAFYPIFEGFPSTIKKNTDRLSRMVQTFLILLSSISPEVTNQWTHPPDGHDEDNGESHSEDDAFVSQTRTLLDQMMKVIGYEFIAEKSKAQIKAFYQGKDDWRTIYASLMFSSQLGQSNHQLSTVDETVTLALKSLKHQNPKVRFAALHCLGQLSDDMKPHFQFSYTQLVVPNIIQSIDDPIPRVCSHSLACFTNFMEEYIYSNQAQNYAGPVIAKCKAFLQNPHTLSYIKENSLSVLASLSTIQQLLGQEEVDGLIQTITVVVNKSKNPEKKQLRGQCLQTLSFVLFSQDKDYTKKHRETVTQLIFQLTDPAQVDHSYILAAWIRIFESQHSPYPISKLFDKIEAISKSFDEIETAQPELSIKVFKSMLKSYGTELRPYCSRALQIVMSRFQGSQDVVQEAIDFFLVLVSSTKSSAPDPQWNNQINSIFCNFSSKLSEGLQEQSITGIQNVQALILALSDLIKEMSDILNPQQICQILSNNSNQLNLLDGIIQKRKADLQSLKTMEEEDLPQKDIEVLQNTIHQAYECKRLYPDIFQSLMRIVPDNMKKQIIQGLLQLIQKAMAEDQNYESIRYGIYYIDNLLEDCSFDLLAQLWVNFDTLLSKYSTHKDVLVRHSAIYGLGLLAGKTPNMMTPIDKVNTWLNIIFESFTVPQGQQELSDYKSAQDNSISALGRLLKNFLKSHKLQYVLKQWAKNLPLNADKIEGNGQHEMLMDILNEEPSLLIQNKEDLLYVLKIYAKFIQKRHTSSQYSKILQKTKASLLKMNNWPLFKENNQFMWDSLSECERFVLTKVTTQ